MSDGSSLSRLSICSCSKRRDDKWARRFGSEAEAICTQYIALRYRLSADASHLLARLAHNERRLHYHAGAPDECYGRGLCER